MSTKGVPTENSWKRMLTARPLRNVSARPVSTSGENVELFVKTQRPWYHVPPISWIIRVRPEKKASLDGLGSEIWRLCDGTRTVESVIDDFASNHKLTFHESRTAVTAYLKTLIQRGVLGIELPKERP